MIAASREWVVLKLGALIIATAIEPSPGRRKRSAPDPGKSLIRHAYGHSFAGVGREYDEHDVPRLVGRRPTGEAVHGVRNEHRRARSALISRCA